MAGRTGQAAVSMELGTFGVQPGLSQRMIGNDLVTVMAGGRWISVGTV